MWRAYICRNLVSIFGWIKRIINLTFKNSIMSKDCMSSIRHQDNNWTNTKLLTSYMYIPLFYFLCLVHGWELDGGRFFVRIKWHKAFQTPSQTLQTTNYNMNLTYTVIPLDSSSKMQQTEFRVSVTRLTFVKEIGVLYAARSYCPQCPQF